MPYAPALDEIMESNKEIVQAFDQQAAGNIVVTEADQIFVNFSEFEKQHIRIVNPRKRELHLILVGNEDPDQFIMTTNALYRLGDKYDIIINLVQYRKDTGRFLPIGRAI
jgi:hypothetical protein